MNTETTLKIINMIQEKITREEEILETITVPVKHQIYLMSACQGSIISLSEIKDHLLSLIENQESE